MFPHLECTSIFQISTLPSLPYLQQDYRDEDLDIEDVRGGLFRYRTGGQALREEKRQRTRELMRLLRRRDPAPPHVYLAVMQDILLLQAHALCAYLGVSQELFLASVGGG